MSLDVISNVFTLNSNVLWNGQSLGRTSRQVQLIYAGLAEEYIFLFVKDFDFHFLQEMQNHWLHFDEEIRLH